MPQPARPSTTLNPRHSTSAVKKSHKAVWLWIVGIIVVVLIAVGATGLMFYKQAKQVQAHEMSALDTLKKFKAIKSTEEIATVRASIPQLQKETSAAHEITEGPLWKIASAVPSVGSDISTVRGMTEIVDRLSQEAIPGYLDTVDALTSADLKSADGSLNLEPILKAQETLPAANKLIQAATADYNSLNEPKIGMIKSAYDKGKSQLAEVAEMSDNLTETLNIVPGFLGAEDSKNYIVTAVTPAEARSSGGLVGSLGSMTTDKGKITMGAFYPNSEFISLGAANETAETEAIFNTPLNFSFDIRDQAALPDFSQVAKGITEIWSRSPYATTTPNGVIQVDPVFLQEVNKISGAVTLSNGMKLDGNNTAEYLLNTIYKAVPVEQQNAVFGEVAATSVKNLFSDLNFGKMLKIAKMLPDLAQQRHFQMTSDDPETQAYLVEAGYSPAPQQDETKPTVGIYLNQNNASKLDWYLQRSTTVTRTACNTDGTQEYHVRFEMKNALSSVSGLPTYVVGDAATVPVGTASERILFSAPAGGAITNMQVSGNATAPQEVQLNGKGFLNSLASVAMGQTVAYELDVVTSANAASDLAVDQTPTTDIASGITFALQTCSIEEGLTNPL